jgi:competence transcription factor ComK
MEIQAIHLKSFEVHVEFKSFEVQVEVFIYLYLQSIYIMLIVNFPLGVKQQPLISCFDDGLVIIPC